MGKKKKAAPRTPPKKKPASPRQVSAAKRATKKSAATRATKKRQQTTADAKPAAIEVRTTDDLAAAFADFTDESATLQARVKQIAQRLAEIADVLKDRFVDQGIQSVNVHGRTVYLHRQLWARKAQALADGQVVFDEKGRPVPVATGAVVDAMREAGPPWDDLCYETFNTSSLSAVVRDEEVCPRDDDDMPILPTELDDFIRVSEELSIKAKKS